MQLALVFAFTVLGQPSDSDAAFADRARFPPDEPIVYLTLSTVPEQDRERLEKVARFVVPSLSSRSFLADQLPQRVEGTSLLRLQLNGLGWDWQKYAALLQKFYVPTFRPDLIGKHAAPLVVRADWWCANMIDPTQTPGAADTLLYGKELKTSDEFRKFWRVNAEAQIAFGRIEGASGVALQRARLIENHASAIRAYHWQTFDSRVVAGDRDPLENLTARPPKHDATELIAGIPKTYAGQSGTLQAYYLADGKGARQDRAPPDIVADTTGIRGPELKNNISCIACHDSGLQHPTLDSYREYILSGAKIYTKGKATQAEIDRYLDSPIAKEITRNNEDYAAGVNLCNGLTPAENAKAFREVVQAYDAPVGLEQGAREMYTTTEEFKLALGNYSRTGKISGRPALLANDIPISRQQFNASIHQFYKAMELWNSGH